MSIRVFNTGDIPTAGDFNGLAQNGYVAVTGGTIDGAVIGAVTPVAGAFTKLTATTPALLDNSSNVATTAFVMAATPSMSNMVTLQGVWNAGTNTPALSSGTGTKGFTYVVSVPGVTTLDGNSNWVVNDVVMYNGTTWTKIHGSVTEVTSVAGRSGAVVLTNSDITGLGTMATQAASAVAITGGTFSGSTISTTGQLVSTLPTGNAPFVVASTTPVVNLTATNVVNNANMTGDITSVGNVATLVTSGVTAGTYGTSTLVPQITFDSKGRAIAVASIAMTAANLNGDVTTVGNTATLAASGVTAGAYGSATSIPQITFDTKGRATSVTSIAMTTTALTGDVTTVGNTATLAASGVTAGIYGSATSIPQVTFDAKGRATSVTAIAMTSSNLTGDVTSVGNVATLATSGVTAGTYGLAGSVAQIGVDSKGRTTSASNVLISIPNTQVTGLGTMATQNAAAVAITGGTIAVTSVNATTHSATGQYTSTLATGTAPFVVASTTPVLNLTASNVTTNANLTGDITSVGNAATLAASGVTAGTYGTATTVPQIAVDAKGRVTSISAVAMAAGSSSNLTGDVTSVGSATTLATSGVTAGTYGAAGSVAQIVIDAKGRATSASNVLISIPKTQVTGLGTMASQNAAAVAITGGTMSGVAITFSGPIITTSYISTAVYTVANLPNNTTLNGVAGARAMVSDSYFPLNSNSVGTSVNSGGTNLVPVYSDGGGGWYMG